MRLALLALAVLAPAGPPGPAAPGTRGEGRRPEGASPAIVAVADALAKELGPPAEGRRALWLAVEARAPSLAPPIESALDAALAARGYAVTPHRTAGDAEAAARAAGQDWLLRVRAGLVPGNREVALVGELIAVWPSFFLQRRPGARAIPPRLVQARATADPETLLVGREPPIGAVPFVASRSIGSVPGRVVALAVDDTGDAGEPVVVAATADAILILSPARGVVARRDLGAAAPVRYPQVALAVGDFGGGRIAVQRAGAPRAEVLALRGGRVELAGTLDAAPLCAGAAGRLFGAFVPGTGVFADVLSPLVDPDARPRSARTLYGAAAAPRGGPIAFAVLGTDLRLELFGPDLAPVRTPAAATSTSAPLESEAVHPERNAAAAAPARSRRAPTATPNVAVAALLQKRGATPTGSAFALADLDGDGTAELVASSADPASPEGLRIFAPLSDAPLLYESSLPERTLIAAAAAGDLTGDGIDDAVLALVVTPAGGAEPFTDLLLVTHDPRAP